VCLGERDRYAVTMGHRTSRRPHKHKYKVYVTSVDG